MKRIAFAVGVAVLVFGVTILAKTQTGSAEQELMKLENQWINAVVKADVAVLDQILADDYTWTGPEGNVITKAEILAFLKSPEGTGLTSAVIDEMKVRVYGDAAVVLGRSTEKGQSKGTAFTDHSAWTDFWIKQAGRWRVVAEHVSAMPQK